VPSPAAAGVDPAGGKVVRGVTGPQPISRSRLAAKAARGRPSVDQARRRRWIIPGAR
jgi:hypothetical protein